MWVSGLSCGATRLRRASLRIQTIILFTRLRRMVLTREHAALAVNDTEIAERFRLYCLPTFREGW